MANDGTSRSETEAAVAALIESGLRELGLSLNDARVSKLSGLVLLLSDWAARINLTGHRGPVEMTSHLLLDALALSCALPELDTASRLVDLGSGAGFPGLPLAILKPNLEVVLVESRLKRHHFQREVCRKLGLGNALPLLGRSEELEVRPADGVIAQAMTRPSEALALMLAWAKPGGWVALPASADADRPELPEGVGALELREYLVPGTGRRRRLWLARVEAR